MCSIIPLATQKYFVPPIAHTRKLIEFIGVGAFMKRKKKLDMDLHP
jgi:hypothetical protein